MSLLKSGQQCTNTQYCCDKKETSQLFGISPRETMDRAVTSRGLNGSFIHPEPRSVQDYRFVFVAPKNSVVHW